MLYIRFHIYLEWYLSLSDSLGLSMLLQMALFILFYGWVVFHCIYMYHIFFNPFISRWTFRLLPCLGCCEECFYEHRGACIFLNYRFVWIYAQEWDCWSYRNSFFSFLRNLRSVFCRGCTHYILLCLFLTRCIFSILHFMSTYIFEFQLVSWWPLTRSQILLFHLPW